MNGYIKKLIRIKFTIKNNLYFFIKCAILLLNPFIAN